MFTRLSTPLFSALLLLITCAAIPSHSQELLTRPLDIAELTQSAGTIVHGQVIAVQEGTHPDYPNVSVVNVTLNVIRNVRGASTSRVTFRQYVQSIRQEGMSGKPARKLRRTNGWRVGEEVVLFLYPNSRYGLTSPVGAQQGKFSVVRDASGAKVLNGAGNASLFTDVKSVATRSGVLLSSAEVAATSKPGAIDLNTFLNVVGRFAAQTASVQ